MSLMSPLDLSKEEQANARAALHFLRNSVGGWDALAKVLYFNERTLANVGQGKTVTPIVAFRIARFAKVTVEDVLTGKFPAPGTCPYCGHVGEPKDQEPST